MWRRAAGGRWRRARPPSGSPPACWPVPGRAGRPARTPPARPPRRPAARRIAAPMPSRSRNRSSVHCHSASGGDGRGAGDRPDSWCRAKCISLYVVGLWSMALTTGVDVAAEPGRVGALGSFAIDAGRFGDACAGRAGRCGRRRNRRDRVWTADRAHECGLVLQAGAFPASPQNATQAAQDRMALRRSQPTRNAASIPHGPPPPASATDPAARREESRPGVRRRPTSSRPAVRSRRVDRISRCRRSGGPRRTVPALVKTSATAAQAQTRPGQQARTRAV